MRRLLNSPVLWFIAALIVLVARNSADVRFGRPVSPHYLDAVLLGFMAACWVARDAKNRLSWPSDHTMLFYPVVFPVYLVVTRKWMGILWLTLLWLGWFLSFILPVLFLKPNA